MSDKIINTVSTVAGCCVAILLIYLVFYITTSMHEQDKKFYEASRKKEILNIQRKEKYREEINNKVMSCTSNNTTLNSDPKVIIKECKKYVYSLYGVN